MNEPLCKLCFVPWYRPVRLAHRKPEGGLEFIGWVWRQRAYLLWNMHHGWIAIDTMQTEEQLSQPQCPYCDRILPKRFTEAKT